MSDSDSQLDATISIVTPENIAFQYRLAGPFRRLPAFLLDLLLRLGVFMLGVFVGSLLPLGGAVMAGVYQAGLLIGWFILDWFYGGLFEAYMNGQTPGKAIMRIRVLTIDGQPISGLQAVMRNVFRYGDFFPLLPLQAFAWLIPPISEIPFPVYLIPTGLVGLGSMALTRKYQRLGDVVCGTVVVMEERHWLTGVAKLDDERVAQLAAFIPADFKVSRSLARTLAAYVDRRRFFSQPRRLEVAKHLGEPLCREFQLPSNTSHDLLLCALYYRTFIADRAEDGGRGESPFAPSIGPAATVGATAAESPAADSTSRMESPLA